VLRSVYTSDSIFIHIYRRLEYGEFGLTTSKVAIALPPGVIHCTYTLAGGAVSGVEFTSKECLEVSFEVLKLNLSAFKVIEDDHRPFLEAVIMNLRSGDRLRQEKAIKLFSEIRFGPKCKLEELKKIAKLRKELKL
jgi:hypothetical protein